MLGVTTFVVQFWKTAMETFSEEKGKECAKQKRGNFKGGGLLKDEGKRGQME